MKIVAVTGYKPMELSIFKPDDERIKFIRAAIRKRLIEFIEEGLEWVIISGQMGVELWTAEVVLELQEIYDIKIGVIPPFENQENRWPEQMQQQYQEISIAADFYQPLYKGDYKGSFQFKAKNMWLVDKSDGCLILIHDEYPGSNRFFYEEAQQTAKDYPIHTITPADLEDVVEELRMEDPGYWD
ncbi:SLOG family protein [Virgibacillus oceani]|uniref:UPF0398 protein YpsA n=1 Tax=Virgibacillus oceani TaxID=1479511 RepID=A0A917M810_9BACI|nr:DUF1273 domain-containing protein [Virgibacillus oceani]GGG83653.1 UPF0398 protein YpsA [Virgibacillus oceani]